MKRVLMTMAAVLLNYTLASAEIRSHSVAGAIFGDALPDGQRVALIAGQRLVVGSFGMDTATIDVPDGDSPWFLRMSEDGEQYAGQSHQGRGTWRYAHGTWRLLPVVAFGESPVLFDLSGRLLIASGGGAHVHRVDDNTNLPISPFVDGLRALDDGGGIILGNTTRADPSRVIWEYTTQCGIAAGQSDKNAIALKDGQRLIVDRGHSTFIRFRCRGGLVSFAISKLLENRVQYYWMTVSDLLTLEREAVDDPDDPDDPPPFECGQIPSNGRDALERLRLKFISEITSRDDNQRRAWALRAAEQMRFMLGDQWGTKRAAGPQSKDSVSRRHEGVTFCNWDIVNGDTRELQFGDGELITNQTFIPVRAFDYLGGTEPDPDPDEKLEARVVALEQAVKGLQDSVGALIEAHRQQQSQIDELRARPSPIDEARVTAIVEENLARSLTQLFVVGRVEGRTNNSALHTHGINVEVKLPVRRIQ